MANVEGRATGPNLPTTGLRDRIPHGAYLIAIAVGGVAVGLYLLRRQGFVGPDTFLLFLVLVAIVIGQARTFLRDWIPFVVIFFGWQMLRGHADNVAAGRGFPIHNEDLIRAERWLFGGELPTVVLQRAFYTPGEVQWYDVVAVVFWAFHFVLALLFAFLVWTRNKRLYWRFVIGLMALSFAGFATYVLYPAVPPWLASTRFRTIQEPVYLLRYYVPAEFDIGRNVSWIMRSGNPNEIAAMPSLHAAYPTLMFLFTLYHWRQAAPVLGLYCLGLWTSIVYMGDHYVIDVLAGILYAVVIFFIVEAVYRWVDNRRAARSATAEVRVESPV